LEQQNPSIKSTVNQLKMKQREGVGGSSRTNLCREWSSCSHDGRRGRIHIGLWPEVVISSSWPGMTDLCQQSLGWSRNRPHTSNCVLVTVVTQAVVGLEKSIVAAGRERRRRVGRVAVAVRRVRALWIYLARSRICPMRNCTRNCV
jgi:hypothetical protein